MFLLEEGNKLLRLLELHHHLLCRPRDLIIFYELCLLVVLLSGLGSSFKVLDLVNKVGIIANQSFNPLVTTSKPILELLVLLPQPGELLYLDYLNSLHPLDEVLILLQLQQSGLELPLYDRGLVDCYISYFCKAIVA